MVRNSTRRSAQIEVNDYLKAHMPGVGALVREWLVAFERARDSAEAAGRVVKGFSPGAVLVLSRRPRTAGKGHREVQHEARDHCRPSRCGVRVRHWCVFPSGIACA